MSDKTELLKTLADGLRAEIDELQEVLEAARSILEKSREDIKAAGKMFIEDPALMREMSGGYYRQYDSARQAAEQTVKGLATLQHLLSIVQPQREPSSRIEDDEARRLKEYKQRDRRIAANFTGRVESALEAGQVVPDDTLAAYIRTKKRQRQEQSGGK